MERKNPGARQALKSPSPFYLSPLQRHPLGIQIKTAIHRKIESARLRFLFPPPPYNTLCGGESLFIILRLTKLDKPKDFAGRNFGNF